MLFSSEGITIDADIPLSIQLTRPVGATYDLTAVEILLSVKIHQCSDLSIFECSTGSPAQYQGLDGQQQTQAVITTNVRTADSLEGSVVLPKERTAKGLLKQYDQAHYTLWMVLPSPDLTIEIETNTCPITRTSVDTRP